MFQSIQKRELSFVLVLTGLPTLFPKLVEARTFAERMFHVMMWGRLSDAESREAILKPIQQRGCPVRFTEPAVAEIVRHSGAIPTSSSFFAARCSIRTCSTRPAAN